MKTVELKRSSRKLEELLASATDEDIIIRTSDGREFLLMAVVKFDEEIVRSQDNKQLMDFLEARARNTETVSFEEAKRRLGL